MNKLEKKLSLSVIVITSNRLNLVKQCLKSIIEQTINPDCVTLVENSNSNYFFSLKKLKKLFSSNIKIKYKKTRNKNASYLRNIGMYNDDSELILCIDDDVILDKNYLKVLVNQHKKFPNATSFVGKILPTNKSILSQYSSAYFMQTLSEINRIQSLRLFPSSTFSIRKNNHNPEILFDETMDYCEDIDFFLRMTYAKEVIIFHPELISFHKFRSNFFGFFLTFFHYSCYYLSLERKFPNEFSYAHLFPNRKIHFLFFPIFVLYKAISTSKEFNNINKLGEKFFIPSFLCHFATLFGIYISHDGKKNLYKNFCKAFFTSNYFLTFL